MGFESQKKTWVFTTQLKFEAKSLLGNTEQKFVWLYSHDVEDTRTQDKHSEDILSWPHKNILTLGKRRAINLWSNPGFALYVRSFMCCPEQLLVIVGHNIITNDFRLHENEYLGPLNPAEITV